MQNERVQIKITPDPRTYQELLDGDYLKPDGHNLRPKKIEEVVLGLKPIGLKPEHADVMLKLRGVSGPYRYIRLTKGQLQQLLDLGSNALIANRDGQVRIKHSVIYLVKPN